jgi:hypothetical protein
MEKSIEKLGQVAFESAAKLTDCKQTWEEANQAKWCAAAKGIVDALNKGIEDANRLDFLQSTTKGYGVGWILRESTSGRGMRLHETENVCKSVFAKPTVREAIDAYMNKEE